MAQALSEASLSEIATFSMSWCSFTLSSLVRLLGDADALSPYMSRSCRVSICATDAAILVEHQLSQPRGTAHSAVHPADVTDDPQPE